MKRTKSIKPPSAILTADWHVREDIPVCRTDDFQQAQWRKINHIAELQKKYQCPVFHAGDLFHHWKPSPQLLTKCIMNFPDQFYTVYGNHDLPQHNMELAEKSGVATLEAAGAVKIILGGGNWNEIPEGMEYGGRMVAVWHIMTYAGKLPYPGCTAPQSNELLKKYPQFDLILTGDNHQSFTANEKNRVLVNPGSLTRQTADKDGDEPCVYFWYADTNTVMKHVLPFDAGVITREHIDRKEERNERIEAFVSRLNTDWESSLDFVQNLRAFESTNQIRKSVMNIVYKAVETN